MPKWTCPEHDHRDSSATDRPDAGQHKHGGAPPFQSVGHHGNQTSAPADRSHLLCGASHLYGFHIAKALRQIAQFPPELIPNPIIWRNYSEVFYYAPMHRYFLNTFILVVPAVFGAIFTSSLAAYAFARLRAPGRNVIFMILLSTMMVPAFVTMIPTYILFAELGWVGGFKPLTIPYLAGSAFFVFLLRQFFLTIPRELEDAAFMDGAGRLHIYTHVVLPLAKPVLATVTIFAFMSSWNEYMGPLIYLGHKDQYVLSLGPAGLHASEPARVGAVDGGLHHDGGSRYASVFSGPEALCAGHYHERHQGLNCPVSCCSAKGQNL